MWFTEDEGQVQKLQNVVFPGGRLNKDVVGGGSRIRAMAGIDVPATARLVLPAKGAGVDDVLIRRSCVRLSPSSRKTFQEAVENARSEPDR